MVFKKLFYNGVDNKLIFIPKKLMITQDKILNQLNALETLSKKGSYSDKFAISLENIILEEIKNIEQEIAEIKVDLQTFEQEYKLSSEEFYQQFKAGQLGDDIDFVEWNVFYQMWCSLEERLNLLKSQL